MANNLHYISKKQPKWILPLCKIAFLAVLTLIICLPGHANAIPAFPGAEGFGANAIGGRGGQVIKVTNLNDSGSGSLREAVTTSGPRIVVFEVSGIIDLQSELLITEPYLTIAGQTSPGGILITGSPTRLFTYHVIIQHMRFRVGSHRVANYETHDTFEIWGNAQGHVSPGAHDVIIDHSSFSWGIDENFSTAYNPYNITIQWSIISEGLSHAGHPKGEHSKGLLIWNKYSPDTNVSLHHNYFAHNTSRNPEIGFSNYDAPITDCRNNIAYNWYGGTSPSSGGNAKANWVHNYSKQGTDSNSYSFEVIHAPEGATASSQIYAFGNIGSTRLSQSDPQWNVGKEWRNELLSEGWRKTTPWAAASVTTTEMSISYALEILGTVGASKPVRDSVDTRVINDFINTTGNIRDNVSFPGDFPSFSSPSAPTDSDNDGMADNWETTNGLNTSTNDSALDKDSDGYTNIEEYLHYLSGESVSSADQTIPSAPTNLTVSQ